MGTNGIDVVYDGQLWVKQPGEEIWWNFTDEVWLDDDELFCGEPLWVWLMKDGVKQ